VICSYINKIYISTQAMFVDFGMAEQYDGVCYLRYDDTNPDAEKLEYIEHIQEIVAWMGWKAWKITYSSDYFDELHAFAIELIKRGHAYVCHQVRRVGVDVKSGRSQIFALLLSSLIFEKIRRGLLFITRPDIAGCSDDVCHYPHAPFLAPVSFEHRPRMRLRHPVRSASLAPGGTGPSPSLCPCLTTCAAGWSTKARPRCA